MEGSQLRDDVERLGESLGSLPEPMVDPPFVVVSGLPGTGKSYFCGKLAERLPFVILESDALRRVLFPSPDYSPYESSRLFRTCHCLIEDLLRRGIPVILDATNLLEHHRERLYHIADQLGIKLIIVRVEAPPMVVCQRLQARVGSIDPEGKSEAGWEVYQKMKPGVQSIHRSHFAVDTSRDITPAIDKIVREVKR